MCLQPIYITIVQLRLMTEEFFLNKMEKVTLYDKDNDKVYDIMLSPEDARRVAVDITFATSILNASIMGKNITEKNEITSEDLNENTQSDAMSEASDVHIQSTDISEESSLYRWPEASVLLLLRTYEEMEEKLNTGKLSHKKCWELIAQILKKNGCNVTGPQCASKLRSLKKTYKSIKDIIPNLGIIDEHGSILKSWIICFQKKPGANL
ncbi:uncharacterized protein [Linepithema humile]|uniref:uncharacterized protein n=1 Tax=Linepithema humile TaxID=83485 RepID=UPI00351E8268